MKIYELTNKGYELVDNDIPQMNFTEENCFWSTINDYALKFEYELENMPFDINMSYFLVLLQDIHNNIPCGTLHVYVPVGEDFDTIIYIIRFDTEEFEKVKKIYLTKFPE